RTDFEESYLGRMGRWELLQWEVKHGSSVRKYAVVLGVFDHSHYLHRPIPDAQVLAERVAPGKQAMRQRLIDNCDVDGILMILRTEVAPKQQWRSERREEPRAGGDHNVTIAFSKPLARRPALNRRLRVEIVVAE